MLTWLAMDAGVSDARRACTLRWCHHDAIRFVIPLIRPFAGMLGPRGCFLPPQEKTV